MVAYDRVAKVSAILSTMVMEFEAEEGEGDSR